jgi:tRNA pseudouridine55 synthase
MDHPSRRSRPVRPERQPRRVLHGVLLLDKPLGWSSNDALVKVRGLLRAAKAGHTGTLDPLASGLLPVCFGAATKFAQVALDADKRYRATLGLGRRTSTGDLEGEVVAERPVNITRERLDAACAAMRGEIGQLPPMHSALKHQGRALYDYARAGVEVAREPRRVTIHALDIVEWDADQPERVVVDVRCSKGTYIRTLAEDLGQHLGCGAHLSALRRTGSGALDVADAIGIEALAALDEPARDARLLPPDTLLTGWPAVELPDDEAGRFLCGLRRRVALADAAAVRVYGPLPAALSADLSIPPCALAFLGSAHITAGELIADRLLSPQEVRAALQAAAAATA